MPYVPAVKTEDFILVAINGKASKMIADAELVEPQNYVLAGQYVLYNYYLPDGTFLSEGVQGSVKKGENLIYFTALRDEDDHWIEDSLWDGVDVPLQLN